MASTSSIQSRPYRSHRVPACIRCRSRKIRCHIDIPGEPCLSCRERRLKCQYVDQSQSANASPGDDDANVQREGARKRRRSEGSNGDEGEGGNARPRSAPVLHKPSTHPEASIILAPHIAEDVDILQRHISQHRTAPDLPNSDPYQTLSSHDTTHSPIVYLTVPRFRTGLASDTIPGKEQLEIIQQLMGPFKREVIDLFFTHVHPNFPVLDEETCAALRKGGGAGWEGLSCNMRCVVYAIGAPHWYLSGGLKMHPKPDTHFIWNKAIKALLEDFLSPSMATVASSVLDQIGRPSVSIVGNITLCGRTVSLAQTFGLHRDPSKWNITEHEKSVRIRTWWGVVITDYWTSIAYGVLPHITKRFCDVPMPTVESLLPSSATSSTKSSSSAIAHKYATTCFVHLCRLTQLLGDIIPLVYEIDPDRLALSLAVEQLKARLNELERQLPEWLPLPNKPGSSNLWFCFLSMRLLLARVTLRAAILEGSAALEKARLDELRAASAAVLDFILYLGESQFLDFWLPFATHLLVHAVTVSLRCTVETQDVGVRNAEVERLERVIAHIQRARDEYDWDIAIYCLERCSDSVSKIASLTTGRAPQPSTSSNTTSNALSNSTQPSTSTSTTTTTTVTADPTTPFLPTPSSVQVPTPAVPTTQGSVAVPSVDNFEAADASVSLDDSTLLLSELLDPNAFDFSWEALWDTPSGMGNLNFSL